mgnify:CR=1 FL=1
MYIGKIETGKSYKKIIIAFLLISVFLIAFVSYASFSRAEIKVKPKKEDISIDYEVKVESNQDIDLSKLQNINGRVIQVELEETHKITEVANKTVDDYAKGTATIVNNLGHSQPLLPRSQLLSDSGVLFRTDTRIVVPAHGRVEVGITADQPGESGNLEPTHFTIVKIWTDWQNSIYGETDTPTSGGTREGNIASQEELDLALEKVKNDLYAKGVENIKTQLNPSEEVINKAVRLELIEYDFSVKPDTETTEYDVKAKVKLTAAIFNEKTLIDLGIAKLKKKISASKEFIEYNQEKTNYEVVEYNIEENWAKVKVHLEGFMIAKLGNEAFDKDKLSGRDESEILSYYDRMPEIESTLVKFSPFWVKSVPSLKDHIEIIVEK